jgi:hypothetical protein
LFFVLSQILESRAAIPHIDALGHDDLATEAARMFEDGRPVAGLVLDVLKRRCCA